MSAETPIFIDFEASSLDLIASYPIEVGVCLPNGETHSWLIRPHVIWQDWSAKAARIHGIPREELIENGRDLFEVATELNECISGTVYCDAWTFDSFWLHRLYKAAGFKNDFQLESISALLDEQQVSRWQDVHDETIKAMKLDRHRAANDALILHETWKRLMQG
jgi:DNA polymerase III epsilon subunit-like protein